MALNTGRFANFSLGDFARTTGPPSLLGLGRLRWTATRMRYRESMPTAQSRVVSVANERTLPIWAHGHKAILSRIRADRYTLIVPRHSVGAFEAVTDSRVGVEDEESFLSEIRPVLEARLSSENPRFGWYLQQFIKLSAIERFSASENVVIWDADTIPLRRLSFFSNQGKPRYYASTEYHSPYFDVIEKCFGLQKKVDHSFIAQCFPVEASHGRSFFDALRTRSGRHWWEALIEQIDFTQESGFSEYETIGTYITHVFPESIEWQSRHWTRNGWKVLQSPKGAVRGLSQLFWAQKFDYCSFELWQKPSSS